MKTGIELITEERKRQIEEEAWTPEHDDEYTDGELSSAACVYAMKEELRKLDVMWPWEMKWYKPTENRIRELTKAGALIAAEIDRLQRLREKK